MQFRRLEKAPVSLLHLNLSSSSIENSDLYTDNVAERVVVSLRRKGVRTIIQDLWVRLSTAQGQTLQYRFKKSYYYMFA